MGKKNKKKSHYAQQKEPDKTDNQIVNSTRNVLNRISKFHTGS